MKRVLIERPGKVILQDCEEPVLAQGQALLKILYGGICGSDIGTYKGTFLYTQYPRIPGHEFSAEIVAVGENPHGLKPGMVVTGNPYYNCGTCYSCRRGLVNCCTGNQTLGCQRDGVFQEYFAMPVERIYDGKGLSARLLTLVEPFCISYHAVKRARIQPGERVLVVGAGTIGYLAAAAARMLGANVYTSDISRQKLAYTERLGVAGTILNSGKEDFDRQVNALTHGDGFDVCIEAVGLPSTFMNCIDAAAYRGRVVVVGIGKVSLDFFYSIIQKKELDLFGSRNALREDFLELIDSANAHRIDLEGIISAEYSYLQAAEAFENAASRGGELLKTVLRFGDH